MSITQRLRTRLASRPGYACDTCALTYDRDRLNCPACGGRVREVE